VPTLEELWDQACLSHQVLLLPVGDNAAGDPVAEEGWHVGVRMCNGPGHAEGPVGAGSTMEHLVHGSERWAGPPGSVQVGSHILDTRSAGFPARPSQKDEKLLPCQYLSEQKNISGRRGAGW